MNRQRHFVLPTLSLKIILPIIYGTEQHGYNKKNNDFHTIHTKLNKQKITNKTLLLYICIQHALKKYKNIPF